VKLDAAAVVVDAEERLLLDLELRAETVRQDLERGGRAFVDAAQRIEGIGQRL